MTEFHFRQLPIQSRVGALADDFEIPANRVKEYGNGHAPLFTQAEQILKVELQADEVE